MGIAEETRLKLLPRFRETTADRVERLAAAILASERGGGDSRAEIARELHTLKGEARMMGFAGMAGLAHAAEDLLAAAGAAPGREAIDALLGACDALGAMVDRAPDGGHEAEAAVATLRALAARSVPPAQGPAVDPAPAAATGPSAGAAASPAGPTGATAPSAAPATPAPAATPARGRGGEAAARLAAGGDGATTSIRVDVDRLDEIAAIAGDVLVDGARALRRARELGGLVGRWSRLLERVGILADSLRRAGAGGAAAERLEGDVHLLRSDTFRFLRAHTEAVQGAQAQFSLLAERIGTARLIPLSGVLAAFPRAAREMAREQEKEVEVVLSGAETGVDKAILLALNDPLVHLVRNAIDHGLETPAAREAAGKPRAGRLTISARGDGDLLVLAVEDDGRGIDPEAIRRAARERGLLAEGGAAAVSDRAALDLIFAPGFSTRARPGETSGRGIGLDVVRRRAAALGGSVTVEPVAGGGARFVLRLPQSLSLMKVLLVKVDEDVYGLPAADVEAVGRLDPEAVTEVAGIRTVEHRGRLLPLVALGPLLSLNGGPRHPRPAVAYLAHGTDGAALVVDGLHGEREVAVKAPGAFLKGLRYLTGAAALEDGRVALLLSTADLVGAARRASSPVGARPGAGRRLRVLLVDDSLVAREAEAALLRSLGHEVDEAADGEEGWRRLQGGGHAILITDVQMPGLDGIDLTRRVRAAPGLAALPVLILSSLSAPEERRRGVDAGADAYLVKGELDARTLADALERLCGVGR